MKVAKEFIVERDGKSFVLYAGLLALAHEEGLKSILTQLVQIPSAENGFVAVCSALVETERGRFAGIGDASPDNVTRMMRPHIIRMAETRAKARALRDAVNVGVAALEELGESGEDDDHHPPTTIAPSVTTRTLVGASSEARRAAPANPPPADPPPVLCPVHQVPTQKGMTGTLGHFFGPKRADGMREPWCSLETAVDQALGELLNDYRLTVEGVDDLLRTHDPKERVWGDLSLPQRARALGALPTWAAAEKRAAVEAGTAGRA